MKRIVGVFAVTMMIAGLCAGCGRADKSEPEINTKNSVPEKAEQSKAHSADDGQDHSGHNH